MTTIKVTRKLRDRLAERAHQEHISMGSVIERAIAESEDKAFWDAVRRDNASLTDAERQHYLRTSVSTDDLADHADDVLSKTDGW